MDLAAFDRNDRVFFTVKDSGRSFVYQHLVHNSGALHYASVRRQVAFQHGKAAGLGIRMVNGPDHFRILVDNACDIFPDCLSCNGHTFRMQEILFI